MEREKDFWNILEHPYHKCTFDSVSVRKKEKKEFVFYIEP